MLCRHACNGGLSLDLDFLCNLNNTEGIGKILSSTGASPWFREVRGMCQILLVPIHVHMRTDNMNAMAMGIPYAYRTTPTLHLQGDRAGRTCTPANQKQARTGQGLLGSHTRFKPWTCSVLTCDILVVNRKTFTNALYATLIFQPIRHSQTGSLSKGSPKLKSSIWLQRSSTCSNTCALCLAVTGWLPSSVTARLSVLSFQEKGALHCMNSSLLSSHVQCALEISASQLDDRHVVICSCLCCGLTRTKGISLESCCLTSDWFVGSLHT